MPENPTNNNHLNSAFKSLADCEDVLAQVADTCCMLERSPMMEAVAEELQKARDALTNEGRNRDNLSACVAAITECGARIGKLQVSCCTEIRSPLYERILDGLNKAHNHIGRAMEAGQ
ncbi:MAG TPA: hypothetical protein VIU33_08795 [Nitrospiria bacterium]